MVSKKLQDELNHKIIRAIFVCSECGRYRVEKLVALPKQLPLSLDKEYCPVCEKNAEFFRIG